MAMLKKTLVIGFLALLANTAMYRPVTGPTPQSERFEGALGIALGTVWWSSVPASVLAFIWLAVEGRRRASLVRELDHERDFHRRVWDASEDGMALVDVNSAVVEWNPAMERLTGVGRRRALGMIVTAVPGLGGPGHTEYLRLALAGVETAADRSAFESHNPMTAPKLRTYYSPRRSAEGDVVGAFVLVTGWSQAAHARLTAADSEASAA
jgi:PAS domain-containing protein